MRLRNKKTGEIGEVGYLGNSDGKILVNNINDLDTIYEYDSLAEFNAEWEDYEEPKEPKKYWFINSGGGTASYYEEDEEPEDTEACKEIGNYFDTREEAEKAVEKLKAWKRLEDKGFRFEGHSMLNYAPNDTYDYSPSIGFSIPELDKDEPYEYPEEIEKDLDICFGGEE